LRAKTREDRLLLDLIDPLAEAMGYAVVRLRLIGGGKGRTLQVMAEDASGEMRVEDCSKLARAILDVLESADPVGGDYSLEVSSPGVDRPLTRIEDFETYEGLEARIELDRVADGRKRFKGLIAGVEGDAVGVDEPGSDETVLIPFAWITDAKLSLTDELLKRGAAKRAERIEQEHASEDANPE